MGRFKSGRTELMLGAISGDIIGSIYESGGIRTTEFDLFDPPRFFTDDSVLTVATAEAILRQFPYEKAYRKYVALYPDAGFGGMFLGWARDPSAGPYGSFGNGSAMRVSPVAWAFENLEEVLKEAKKSAEVTHNHPEGIKGAQAVAAGVYFAREGKSKEYIKSYIEKNFAYELDKSVSEIRQNYCFNVTCQGSVPQAICAFLESMNFEDTVKLAVSLGGDSDTIAAMAGSIAEAYYGVPESIREKILLVLDDRLRTAIFEFEKKFNVRRNGRATR